MKTAKTSTVSFRDTEIQYSLTYREVVEILGLIRQAGNCRSVELAIGDMKLSFQRSDVAERQYVKADTAPPVQTVAPVAKEVEISVKREAPISGAAGHEFVIRAPMLGTFYRSPEPGAEPYVDVGDVVAVGDTIGLIEVMKLFSPVVADIGGRIVQFLSDNAVLVEYGQPLVRLEAVS